MSTEESGFGDLRFNEETGEWYTIGKDAPLDAYGRPINPSDIISIPTGSASWLKGIGDLLKGTGLGGTAGQLLGLTGIGALLNRITGGGGSQFSGYKGGIPEYKATYTQTPFAQQRPTTTVGGKTVPYRPGQGGITYFTPMQYAYQGRDLAAPTPPPTSGTGADTTGGGGSSDTVQNASGGYMPGGITMLAKGGSRFLRGPGDGVSDSIPATIADKQPARLADGEFVIDARTVSELGNGSSEAGARKLYEMMDRVHSARRTAKRGKPSGADKYLPK